MTQGDCLFCKIASGDVPATLVRESDRALAFRDINPQAPTHVLVIPREHRPDVATLAREDPQGLADLLAMAADVAEEDELRGYRIVFNTGTSAGQTVFHVHAHLLGGRGMGWPPG